MANLVEKGIAQRQTAAVHLKALVALGVLIEEKVGRDKLYLHWKYRDLLSGEDLRFEAYPPFTKI